MAGYLSNITNAFTTTFESLSVTFSHLFRTPYTVQYPDRLAVRVQETLPYRYRGILEVDLEICTGCLACERACPIDCIVIEAVKDKETKEMILRRFDIDIAKCMFCGLCSVGVLLFGDWGAKFYFNAVVAAAVALVAFVLMRDTPQSCGLPPIEEHRNDYPPEYSEAHERNFTFRQIFLEHVLNNKYLWAIAVANAFVYFVRYGVVNWIPTYLQTHKGFSFQQSSLAWSMYEWAAIPGTIACGWMSDRVFKSRRAPATILFMALTLVAVIVYWLNIDGPLWIDYAALIAIGFLIYGPIMIIGLHALDLVPKKAAGTAAGFTGFLGYVFGSAIARTGVGWIADHWGWNGVLVTMVVNKEPLSTLKESSPWRRGREKGPDSPEGASSMIGLST